MGIKPFQPNKEQGIFIELLEAAPDATVIVNTNGIIQFINSQTEKLFGYKRNELLGKAVEVLIPSSLHHNHINHRENYTKDPHTRPMGVGLELEAIKKDGTKFPVEISLSPLRTDKVNLVSASIRDITEHKNLETQLKEFNEDLEKKVEQRTEEHKKAEEKLAEYGHQLRLFVEYSPAALAMVDKDMKYIVVSKRWLLDYKLENKDITGKSHYEIFPEIQQHWKEIHQRCLAGAIEKKEEDLFIRADGSIDWVRWEIHPWHKTSGEVGGIILFTEVITERKKAEEKIISTADKLRQLTSYLQNIREEERKRIGREIHDELGQQLTAIKMDIAWIDKKTPDEANLVKQKLKNIITLLDGSNQSLRKILNELMPRILDENGLLEALQWQSRQFKENTGIAVEFITDETSITLAEDLATCIFRLYQESLTNVMRHAEAKKVLASLHIRDNNISFIIEDDGKGFETGTEQENRSFGILGMRERVLSFNGTFELVSAKGKGTKIMINLPYKKP